MPLKIVATALAAYPLVAALLLIVTPWRSEKTIARIVFAANLVNGGLTGALALLYALSGFTAVELSWGPLVSAGEYHFNFILLIDKYSVAFQLLIGTLTGLVLMFSTRYMHREPGYIRFFASLFLFVAGISLVSLAATIDLLFAGWEIVGISSFLLIGFYRMRLQPGRNSLRAYAIYRFCDVGLFLGAWLFHKLGSEYFFLQFADRALDTVFVDLNLWFFVTIGILIVLAAMGKSAQYPFSFWVPRAMEGPTPSSAIFYGALSIHAGVYLLIRMYPLWRAVPAIPWAVGAIGLITAVNASVALKTQSNVKGQIGYASVAQVGLMFFELALGWRELAMLHFVGNAVLRCYQMLASPSIMVLYLKQQTEGATRTAGYSAYLMRLLPARMRRWYFAVSFSEGYAEWLLNGLWDALKSLARSSARYFSPFVFINMMAGLLLLVSFGRGYLGDFVNVICAVVFGASAIFVAGAALGQNTDPMKVLWMTGLSALFKGLSVIYLNADYARHSVLYFSGILIGFTIAHFALRRIPSELQMTEYAGAAELHPVAMHAYFIGILWMSGFTLSPTFFGDDILLHLSAEKFAYETFFIGSAFILNAVTLMRSYVKLAFAR